MVVDSPARAAATADAICVPVRASAFIVNNGNPTVNPLVNRARAPAAVGQGLALSQRLISAQMFGGPGLYSALKLTGLYLGPEGSK